MSAALERKIIRWFHILASIPILGYVYGPVATIPEAARAVKWAIFPAVILSGFWLWLGPKVKVRWRRFRGGTAPVRG
jgi:hypothetical protein